MVRKQNRRSELWSNKFRQKLLEEKFSPRMRRDLENISFKGVRKMARRIRDGEWLLLTGVTGSGKTLYSARVMQESMKISFVT
jgi:type II secretory pathway predicted ATPase ExeA